MLHIRDLSLDKERVVQMWRLRASRESQRYNEMDFQVKYSSRVGWYFKDLGSLLSTEKGETISDVTYNHFEFV